MLNWVKSGLWLAIQEQSRSCCEATPSYFSCVLRVIVLLEGKPAAQVWGPEALWRRFSSRISLCTWPHSSFPRLQTSRPVPAAEKQPPQHDAATNHASLLGLYWTGDEQCLGFLHTYRLRIKAKSSILVSIRPENPSGCFLANSMRRLSCVLHWGEEDVVGPLCHKSPDWVEGCSDGVDFLQLSPHLPNASLELSPVIFGFFFTSLTKALLPR